MTGYLLDTNVLSELRKGRRAHAAVTNWVRRIPEEQLFTSVLVLGEIRKGIEQIRATDRPQALILETWLHTTETTFSDRVLPVNGSIADEWGRISALRPLPATDALLAATAILHKLVFVTRNTHHVRGVEVDVFDPFLLK